VELTNPNTVSSSSSRRTLVVLGSDFKKGYEVLQFQLVSFILRHQLSAKNLTNWKINFEMALLFQIKVLQGVFANNMVPSL
jgi:hypothetical protein